MTEKTLGTDCSCDSGWISNFLTGKLFQAWCTELCILEREYFTLGVFFLSTRYQ